MKVNVYCGGLPAMSSATESATQRVEQALARFAHRIHSVSLTLDDVNGPRGGEDTHGRCVVQVRGLPPVVLNDRGVSIRAVLDKLIKRVNHTIARRIHRGHTRATRGPSLAHASGTV